ncbi:MAG: hypothetical protein VKJ66_06545 [Synechococcus sp.]|nr:hypothetical protein [Synechococcus sp.]
MAPESAAPAWLPPEARLFPEPPYRRLLAALGVVDPPAWVEGWRPTLAALELPPAHPSLLWGGWLPLLERCRGLLQRGERSVLGLNGPTGAGKSTLMAAITALARRHSLQIAVASIDDFYRPWQARQAVLAGNPYGVWRGPPGSHEPELAVAAIQAWRAGGPLRLPRFDKRLRGGEGDRSGSWEGTPELLLLEGWLVGCRSLPGSELARRLHEEADPEPGGSPLSAAEREWLPRWNTHLESYQLLWQELAGLWQLRPQRWSYPRRWRYQAEARQRRQGGDVLPLPRLEALARACLASLPPAWYQQVPAEATVLLDGRRRCLWSGPAGEAQSSESASSATG